MTARTVTDEQYRVVSKRALELVRRFDAGGLDYRRVKEGLQLLIEGEAVQKCLPYAGEQVESSYGYPDGFRIRTVQKQVEILLKFFPDLDASHVAELASGAIPEWCEGRGVIPNYRLVAKLHSAYKETLTDEQIYCLAFEVVLVKLAKERKFQNWQEGKLTEKHLRRKEKTLQVHAKLNEQPGDFWVIPFQFGKKWVGHSVRNAQARFPENEFGLGPYEVTILLLTHPDRLTGSEQLYIDCAGCEYSPDENSGGGGFGACLIFDWNGSYEQLGLDCSSSDIVNNQWGAASGCLAQ